MTEPDRPSHIWVTTLPGDVARSPKATQLTTGKYTEARQGWTNDGREDVLHVDARSTRRPTRSSKAELFAVPAAGGEFTRVAEHRRRYWRREAVARRQTMAFVARQNGTPERSFSQADCG